MIMKFNAMINESTGLKPNFVILSFLNLLMNSL